MSASDSVMRSIAQTFTPSKDARSLVSFQRGSIKGWLETRLNLVSLFESGSWSHGTATTISDVDYFAWLPAPRPQSAKSAMEKMRWELDFWYRDDSNVSVSVNHPAVRVRFRAPDMPDIEIVPAYWSSGDDYFIPDPAGGDGWIKSNPPAHKEYVDRAQKRDDRAKFLVRLMKGWVFMNQVPIRSLYLEMRAAKRVLDTPPVMPLHDVSWLLNDMASSRLAAMNDPSKYDGRRIAANDTPGELLLALQKIESARGIAARALDYERNGWHSLMEHEVQSLFNLV